MQKASDNSSKQSGSVCNGIESFNLSNSNIGNSNSVNSSYSKKHKHRVYSKRDEEKMLKHAMKLSEIEYKNSHLKIKIASELKLEDIQEAMIFKAREIDFLEPIKYFESLWDQEESCGVFKIIPPESWINYQKEFFRNNYSKKLVNSKKVFSTRIQNLSKLYMAQVLLFFI